MSRNEYAAHAALVASRKVHAFNTSGDAARASLAAYRARKASRSIWARIFGSAR